MKTSHDQTCISEELRKDFIHNEASKKRIYHSKVFFDLVGISVFILLLDKSCLVNVFCVLTHFVSPHSVPMAQASEASFWKNMSLS